MTAASPAQNPVIVRPRAHIENVRADAIRAAGRHAERTGKQPSQLISNIISWALGQGSSQAPFTGRLAVEHAQPDIPGEITACRAFLESTPYSVDASEQIELAHAVVGLLDWLTGADDRPPTYGRQTQPGDLVDGRGRIVRSTPDIRRMIELAQAKLASGQTSHALGSDWHEGVIATLQWLLGDCALAPIRETAPPGIPDDRQISLELGAAEDHLASPRLRPVIPFHYADAVACTCRWLLGGTTKSPVTEHD